MELPAFRYHPDPIATGSVKRRAGTCICCEKRVEHFYVASTYSPADVREKLCPRCIHDGSAHRKFDVLFSDPSPLADNGIPNRTIEAVTQRTPGYISWQQEIWLSHCGDACAFLGDATPETVAQLNDDEMSQLNSDFGVDRSWLTELLAHYEPGGQPAIYHFQCLKCGRNLFGIDYT